MLSPLIFEYLVILFLFSSFFTFCSNFEVNIAQNVLLVISSHQFVKDNFRYPICKNYISFCIKILGMYFLQIIFF